MDWRTDDLTVGSFGGFSFLRRYGLTNFAMQSTLATEPQNQTGRKPSTIVDGPDLQSVQFDLRNCNRFWMPKAHGNWLWAERYLVLIDGC